MVSFLIVSLTCAGIPGLNGFVGLFLILKGSLEVAPIHTASSALGVGLVAVTLMRSCGKMLAGGFTREPSRESSDLGRREIFVVTLLILLIVWMGVAPSGFLRAVESSVELFQSRTTSGAGVVE